MNKAVPFHWGIPFSLADKWGGEGRGLFNNDVIRGKVRKFVSFVCSEFFQIANTEPKPTTNWRKRGEQQRKE